MHAQRGFTLIELMIVVAVLGIIAAIALPSYNEHIRAGKRAEAIGDVGKVQMALERWRAENTSYNGCGTTCTSGLTSTHYTVTVPSAGTNTYTIRAVPNFTDTCGNLEATATTKPTWATASCNH